MMVGDWILAALVLLLPVIACSLLAQLAIGCVGKICAALSRPFERDYHRANGIEPEDG